MGPVTLTAGLAMELSRTPFHSFHVAAGARMVPFAGWEMPVQYVGVKDEHLRVRGAVGVFDVSHMGQVAYRGPKAEEALQWLLTNDISAIRVGQAQYNAMCNEQGGIVDDTFVYRVAKEHFLVVVNASNAAKDVAWMFAHNPRGADIRDESAEWALLAVQGPKAAETVQALTDADLSGIPARGLVPATVAGVEGCILARTGYTGEDGFEIFAPAAKAGPLWDAVLQAGAPFGILPCGLGARDTLRLEVRNALYGHELTDETSPLQAGLGWVVKLDKPGGFVGLDSILARKGKEPHRLVGIVLEGSRIGREGMRVLKDGEDVGWVTSGTRAPSLDRSVCMAYVRRDCFEPGTRLTVDVRGRPAEGEVVKGPFYKRPY